MITHAEQEIARPRQVYSGVAIRDYEPMGKRAGPSCPSARRLIPIVAQPFFSAFRAVFSL